MDKEHAGAFDPQYMQSRLPDHRTMVALFQQETRGRIAAESIHPEAAADP
jgi:hypothetical protein